MKKNILILLFASLALIAGLVAYGLYKSNEEQKSTIASLQEENSKVNKASGQQKSADTNKMKAAVPGLAYKTKNGYHWPDFASICEEMRPNATLSLNLYPDPTDCVSRDDRKIKYGSITKDIVVQWCAKHRPNTKAINITAAYGVDSIGSSGWRCMEKWAKGPL